MTPKEQEIAIAELEEKVDRLRNLYEQYFLGFEKLEPTVARGDVDRRFMLLRKEQIRNTAMRFRFNVVTQKFNTYSMHWVRICRQIEEGTYKRHVRKAQARFGDAARADRNKEERDVSFDIDVDMEEFDSSDVDALLAEVNAGVAAYVPDTSDTVPPPPAPAAAGSGARAPRDQSTPPPMMQPHGEQRMARGAALPPGAKPRVVLRRRDEAEPPPQSARSMPIAPIVAPSPPPPPPVAAPPAASSQRLAAARPALDIPGGRPSGPRIVRSAVAPESAPGVPAAPSSAGGPNPGAQGAPGPGLPSAGRLPIAPPSGGRLPVPAPLPAPSAGRLPVAPQAQGRPGMPVPPLPPTSSPRLPIPGMRAPGGPAPRAPSPSTPDLEGAPSSGNPRPVAPIMRPRAPLPLPSAGPGGPTKKE